MKKKLIAGLLTAAMAATMLAGCGETQAPADNGAGSETNQTADADKSDDSTSDGSLKIGISMPTKSLERWNRDGEYLDKQFKDAGFATTLTFSDNKADQQVSDIQNMIADKVDLLIVAAIDGEALNTAMNEAAEAGIPVISYDRLILNDAVSYYVSFDNYTVGKLQGEYIEKEMKLADGGKYNMEITAGDPADNNAGYFYQGAIDVLQKYIDSGVINVVSGQTEFDKVATEQWNTDTAMERAQNILSSYYADGTQLDIWLCSNDSTALGVAKAIESDYSGKNSILVTGQDGDEANLANIVDGKQTMTVYKNVSNEAVVTLKLAEAMLKGDSVDAGLCDSFGIECSFDTESYQTSDGHNCPSFLLVPAVVTKDNLDYLVDEVGLYSWDGDYLKAN